MKHYIEPRLRRDFGGVITAYFDFLKGDHKNIFTVFLTYNFVLIILLFLANYLSDSGMSSIMALASGTYTDPTLYTESSEYAWILSLVGSVLMMVLNAALAGAYLRLYERDRKGSPEAREVFSAARPKLLGMILILVVGVIGMIPTMIVAVIMAIVPLIGIFVLTPGLIVVYFTWIGMSMFAYAYDPDTGAMQALGKGWEMLFSKFWKALGVSFIVSILLYLLSFLFQLVPIIMIGVFTYNSALDNIEIQENIFIKAVEFFFYAINSIATSLVFFLIMLMLGYLYFNLHESKYNVYLQSRIAKLGQKDEV
ncbi:hypothetical protein [Nonlabens xiamenensis]|uniref:hypothetical protein n=1 Tax=Nonlabens xiamenensis TaxID=2341043 RepID=UPI000F6119CF|nr:hypothetical protein [Nonlabens xiamenensis]